jgi:hypothetical protein
MLDLLFLLTLSLLRSLRLLFCGPPALATRGVASQTVVDFQDTVARVGRLAPGAAGGVSDLLAPFAASFPVIISVFRALAFPFPLLGAVHVRSVITLRAAGGVSGGGGARAEARWEPGSCRPVPRGVESDVTVAFAPLAWVATHTFLFVGARLRRGEGATAYAAAAAAPPPPPAPPAGGASFAPLPLERRSALPGEWAALTGDYNPIHTSPNAAWCFGFKGGVVAHGMGVLLLALAAAAPHAAPAARELAVRFVRPLIIPDDGCRAAWWDEGKVRHVQVLNGEGKCCIAATLRVLE